MKKTAVGAAVGVVLVSVAYLTLLPRHRDSVAPKAAQDTRRGELKAVASIIGQLKSASTNQLAEAQFRTVLLGAGRQLDPAARSALAAALAELAANSADQPELRTAARYVAAHLFYELGEGDSGYALFQSIANDESASFSDRADASRMTGQLSLYRRSDPAQAEREYVAMLGYADKSTATDAPYLRGKASEMLSYFAGRRGDYAEEARLLGIALDRSSGGAIPLAVRTNAVLTRAQSLERAGLDEEAARMLSEHTSDVNLTPMSRAFLEARSATMRAEASLRGATIGTALTPEQAAAASAATGRLAQLAASLSSREPHAALDALNSLRSHEVRLSAHGVSNNPPAFSWDAVASAVGSVGQQQLSPAASAGPATPADTVARRAAVVAAEALLGACPQDRPGLAQDLRRVIASMQGELGR